MTISVYEALNHVRTTHMVSEDERFIDCYEVFFTATGVQAQQLRQQDRQQQKHDASSSARSQFLFGETPVSDRVVDHNTGLPVMRGLHTQQKQVFGTEQQTNTTSPPRSDVLPHEDEYAASLRRSNPLSLGSKIRNPHGGSENTSQLGDFSGGGGLNMTPLKRTGDSDTGGARSPPPTSQIKAERTIEQTLTTVGYVSSSIGKLYEAERKRQPALLLLFQTKLCLVTPIAQDEQTAWALGFGVVDQEDRARDRWLFERGRVTNLYSWAKPQLSVTTISLSGVKTAAGSRPTKLTTTSEVTFLIYAATSLNPSKAIFFFLHLLWGSLHEKYVRALQLIIRQKIEAQRANYKELQAIASAYDSSRRAATSPFSLSHNQNNSTGATSVKSGSRRKNASTVNNTLLFGGGGVDGVAPPTTVFDCDEVRSLARFPDEHAELSTYFGMKTIISVANDQHRAATAEVAVGELPRGYSHRSSGAHANNNVGEPISFAGCEKVQLKIIGAGALFADLRKQTAPPAATQPQGPTTNKLTRIVKKKFSTAMLLATKTSLCVVDAFPLNPKESSEMQLSNDIAHLVVIDWCSVMGIHFSKGSFKSLSRDDQTKVAIATKCSLGNEAIEGAQIEASIKAHPVFKVQLVISDKETKTLESLTFLISGAVPFAEGLMQTLEGVWLSRVASSIGLDASVSELRSTYRAYRSLDTNAIGFVPKNRFHNVFQKLTGSAVLSRGVYSSFLGVPEAEGEVKLLTFVNFLRSFWTLMCGGKPRRGLFLFNSIDGARRGSISQRDLFLWVKQLTSSAEVDTIWGSYPSSYNQWVGQDEFVERLLAPQSQSQQRFKGLGVFREDASEHWGTSVFIGHKCWKSVFHIMIGVSVATLFENHPVRIQRPKGRERRHRSEYGGGEDDEDGDEQTYRGKFITQRIFDIESGALLADVEEPRLVPDAIKHTQVLVELCPEIFKELRNLCGVSMKTLNDVMGISSFTASLVGGTFSGLHEATTPLTTPLGNKGGLDAGQGPGVNPVLETKDGRFHVVLLTPERLHDLLETLPNYYEHIKLAAQTSLLPRYLGLFAVSYGGTNQHVDGSSGYDLDDEQGRDPHIGPQSPTTGKPKGLWGTLKSVAMNRSNNQAAASEEQRRQYAAAAARAASTIGGGSTVHGEKSTCYFAVLLNPLANIRADSNAPERIPSDGRTLLFGRRQQFVPMASPAGGGGGPSSFGRTVMEPTNSQLRLKLPNNVRRQLADIVKRDVEFLSNQVFMANYGIMITVYLDTPPERVTHRGGNEPPDHHGRHVAHSLSPMRHGRSPSPPEEAFLRAREGSPSSPYRASSRRHEDPSYMRSMPRDNLNSSNLHRHTQLGVHQPASQQPDVEYEILADNTRESMFMYTFSNNYVDDSTGTNMVTSPAAQLIALSQYHDIRNNRGSSHYVTAGAASSPSRRSGASIVAGGGPTPTVFGSRLRGSGFESKTQYGNVSTATAADPYEEKVLGRSVVERWVPHSQFSSKLRSNEHHGAEQSSSGFGGSVGRRAHQSEKDELPPTWVCASCGTVNKRTEVVIPKVNATVAADGRQHSSSGNVIKRLKPCYLCFGIHERVLGGTETRPVLGPSSSSIAHQSHSSPTPHRSRHAAQTSTDFNSFNEHGREKNSPDSILRHWEHSKQQVHMSNGELLPLPDLYEPDVAVDNFLRLAGAVDMSDPYHNETMSWRCPGTAIAKGMVKNGFEEHFEKRQAALREKRRAEMATKGIDPYGGGAGASLYESSIHYDANNSVVGTLMDGSVQPMSPPHGHHHHVDDDTELLSTARVALTLVDYGHQVKRHIPPAVYSNNSRETLQQLAQVTASEYGSSLLLNVLEVLGDDFL